jgi:hypothetical protein
MGPALLWLPFYLGAHAHSYLHPETVEIGFILTQKNQPSDTTVNPG